MSLSWNYHLPAQKCRNLIASLPIIEHPAQISSSFFNPSIHFFLLWQHLSVWLLLFYFHPFKHGILLSRSLWHISDMVSHVFFLHLLNNLGRVRALLCPQICIVLISDNFSPFLIILIPMYDFLQPLDNFLNLVFLPCVVHYFLQAHGNCIFL